MKNILLYGTLLSALALNGCGTTSNDGTPAPRPITQATLKGTATDAVITNGTLRVFALEDGIKGELLAETTTDGKGDFSIDDFASKDRPIVIEISDGRYTEEASGVSVELIPGQVMRAYLYYREGTAIDVQVTPLTHLSSCLADYKVSKGININNAITEATSVFSGMIGVDILGTKPLDITDPTNANFELTDGLRYGTVLAAISSLTADISETNGVTPHRFNQNSSIYATQVLCQDISSDGIFNGQGFINNTNSVGQLALGSVPIDVDFLRTRVAQHILNIMSSDRNATNLPVGDFVLYANGIAGSTDAVFGGVATTPVDQEGPVVTANLSPDSFLKGLVDLDFTVSDPIGVDTVQFLVNGAPHSVGQAIAPRMSLNTTDFTDGQITVTVVATDMLNNETRMDFNYVVDNSSPTVSLTSPVLTNSQSYTASGTYQEEGASVASITVNGTEAAIDTANRTWSATVSLVSGQNTLDLEVVDSAGNTGSFESRVDVDLIKPSLEPFKTLVTHTTFEGQLNLCTSGQLTPQSGNNSPVCISTDNVSLNGTALSGSIQNQGYILLGFSPSDPQGAGVFTDQADLTVEYRYEVNDQIQIDWTTAPKTVEGSDRFYYFPMVTEYLGDNWYQTTTADVHKVTFRATDKAGNFGELIYDVRFDVLIPAITATSTISNKSLFTNNDFSTRASVDGQLINVDYKIDNPSNTAYYISLNDAQNHSVDHVVESKIRKNRARIRTVTDWEVNYNYYLSTWRSSSTPESMTAYQKYDNTIVSKPDDVLTEFTNYSSDTIPVSETDWVNVGCIDGITRKVGTTTKITSEPKFICYAFALGAALGGGHRERTREVAEIETGFPRNESTYISTTLNMPTEKISVFNDSIGQEIMPISSWYRIPPKTSIKIVKSIRTPSILHSTDSEVAQADFSSYTAKKLDKSTSWTVDTDLDITRAIDPGSIDKLATVTKFTETIGEGLKTFTISR